MKQPSCIVGAGLSGLIAAHAWPSVPIIEAMSRPKPHRALLRFRSEAVAHLTGIEFKKVLVRKGLWSRGGFVAPSIALANDYSRKVIGRLLGDRSVWSLDPVERWIAPENFQERMLDNVHGRVAFASPFTMRSHEPFVSTAPMPAALKELGIENDATFERAAIKVQRYRVPRCDVHQTVYFPDPDINLYRASVTGDLLIVESANGALLFDDGSFQNEISSAFRIDLRDCEPLDRVTQEVGKIVSLPDATRRSLMFHLTSRHNLYSLGRFAQWRNILLDDVVKDIFVIKRLLATDSYELRKAAA